jgi:hypothetical protein
MRPKKLTRLPEDVLIHITFHVHSRDLGAWRLSCRTLARITEPYRFRTLTLRCSRQMKHIMASVARTPGCASHILHVTIRPPGYISLKEHEFQAVGALAAKLLTSARNLRTLRVRRLAEAWFTFNPQLITAVSNCPRLEFLSLQHLYSQVFWWHPPMATNGIPSIRNLLAHIHSPLRELHLLMDSRRDNTETIVVLALLRDFALTLESLHIRSVHVDKWDESSRGSMLIYPRMRKLWIEDARFIHLPTLEAAFPALCELRIINSRSIQSRNVEKALTNWRCINVLEGRDIRTLNCFLLDGLEVGLLKATPFVGSLGEAGSLLRALQRSRSYMLHVYLRASLDYASIAQHFGTVTPEVVVLDLHTTVTRYLYCNYPQPVNPSKALVKLVSPPFSLSYFI